MALFSRFFSREKGEFLHSGVRYIGISTCLDTDVCPICAQFEDKIFPVDSAPDLPLCPSCRCCYEYYFEDHPVGKQICRKKDFVLPAKCVPALFENQQMIYEEKDVYKKLQLCEEGLKYLHGFMVPYLSAGFPAPKYLACRDLTPELYMRIGKFRDAERVIKYCISCNVYYPASGEEQLLALAKYEKAAIIAVSYIREHPGVFQKDLYNKLDGTGADRECLKRFTRSSLQLRKEPSGKTNKLYLK